MFQVIERYAGAGAADEQAKNSPTAAAALNLLIRRTKAPSRASGTTVAANRATLRSWASESNRGETGSARPLDPPDPDRRIPLRRRVYPGGRRSPWRLRDRRVRS